ncbi:MAG: hypothetical protein MJ248_06690 [Bacilli bacterium]|nr:hypothetical protein [Bacilli bacterium]
MKKTTLCTLSAIAIFCLGSCSGKSTNTGSTNTNTGSSEQKEEIKFFELLPGYKNTLKVPANGELSLEVNKDIADFNYLQLLTKCNQNFKGEFIYANSAKTTQVVSEEFFVEASTEMNDFRQFLDAYRPTKQAVGNFNKIFKSIKFKNITNEEIEIQFGGLNYSDREIPAEDKEVYIEKDQLKVGMDLLTGGTLTYLERTEYDGSSVDQVVDREGNVKIGLELEGTGQLVTKHTNLINIFDAGRQIQQSYYASVGGYGTTEAEKTAKSNGDGGTQNGYTRNLCRTADPDGYYWPYNPVQGGDEKVNFSQIIDYQVTEDTLYAKVRALDWGASGSGGYGNPNENRVTKSYMENWFRIKDGLLYASNRFIDWNGFTDIDNIPAHNIEIPATYISHPLHNFVTYDGASPWTNDANLDRQAKLGPWKNGSYQTRRHSEDWFGWVNDNDFGVGVYIPGATYYASGRSSASVNISDSLNSGANNSKMAGIYKYNKPDCESDYQSCYVRNTNYTAPVKAVKLKNYIPLEYTYVVAVDYIKVFREQFKEIYNSGEVRNTGLSNWDY